jgi:hypothetical protein
MRQRFTPQRSWLIYGSIAAWLLPTVVVFAASPADNLQLLVNDTAAQVQLAYRWLPNERDHRQAELETVVAAWRASTRSEANNERLATWLHAAIRKSMPGSTEPLPQVPTFSASDKTEPQAAQRVEKEAPTVSDGKVDDDPFRDDPVSGRN